MPKWVSIDADIFYQRMCFEEGFHLAQADILAKLKLDQILLAVDDPQSTWKTQNIFREVKHFGHIAKDHEPRGKVNQMFYSKSQIKEKLEDVDAPR